MVLVEVRVIQRLGEGEVVGSVEGISWVEIEGYFATKTSVQLRQFRLKPNYSVWVCYVEESGKRNVLIKYQDKIISFPLQRVDY